MSETEVLEPPPRAARSRLDYKADPAGGPVTVRGIRLLVVLTLINTTLLAMSVLGPQLFPFLRQQWAQWRVSRAEAKTKQAALVLQQQCLAHAAPAEKVVYEEDPAEAARLLREFPLGYAPTARGVGSAPPGWVSPLRAALPPYFVPYVDAVHGGTRIHGADDPLLFLHARTTPGGTTYVVAVQLGVHHVFYRDVIAHGATGKTMGVRYQQDKSRTLTGVARIADQAGPAAMKVRQHHRAASLALPDSERRVICEVSGGLALDATPAIEYGNVMRFFAGQPDPADASHFTIRYQADGREGVIDGWMKDDGLHLRPREGQYSFRSGGEAWQLPVGPAGSGARGAATRGAPTRPGTERTAPPAAPLPPGRK